MTRRVGAANASLAAEYGVPCLADADLVLEQSRGRLQLRDTRPGAPGPIWADFLAPASDRRIRAGRGLLLARACGVRKGRPLPCVLDATAGLGHDAWALAGLGCPVTAVERDPVVFALLRDGLARACAGAPEVAARLELVHDDAACVMAPGRFWDVVYLDPMFPDVGATALPGKEMQYFRALLPHARDDAGLLDRARACATGRVVVKRARLAPPLDPRRDADVTFEGKSVRFDVYLA